MAVEEVENAGTASATHRFALGGIYAVRLIVRSNGFETVGVTNVLVSGAGVHDGVLYVIGTEAADRVQLSVVRKPESRRPPLVLPQYQWTLVTRLVPDRQRRFDASGVDRVFVMLCGGHDQASISTPRNFATPVIVDGGAGGVNVRRRGGTP